MSAFVIKLIAVVSMLIDHAGYILNLCGLLQGQGYVMMRSVGRVAFVIFAFLIANGLDKTSNAHRYFARLVLFAVISQPAYSMAFSRTSYHAAAGAEAFALSFTGGALEIAVIALAVAVYWLLACRGRAELSVLWLAAALAFGYTRLDICGVPVLGGDLNVFYTLAVSLALCACARGALDRSADREERLRHTSLMFFSVAVALLVQPGADYGFMGVILICALFAARQRRVYQAAVIAAWCVFEYWLRLGSLQYALFAMLALIPILLYNGKRGPRFKYGFYLIYPAHLYLFWLTARLFVLG